MIDSKHNRKISITSRFIDRLVRRQSELQKRANLLSQWRLGSFILLFILGSIIFVTWGALPWAVASLILGLPFILSVHWHRQVEKSLFKHQWLLQLKKEQLARLELDWDQIPERGPYEVLTNHPFAQDLNLTGRRSIMHLIDGAVSKEGGQRLCDWLLETEPDPQISVGRQALVKELMDLSALRDRLVLNSVQAGNLGQTVQPEQSKHSTNKGFGWEQWSGSALLQWLDKQVNPQSLRLVLIILCTFVLLNYILLFGYLFAGWPPFWLVSWLIYGAVMISQGRKISPNFQDAAYLKDHLQQVAAVFEPLEKRKFSGKPALENLLQAIRDDKKRPSLQLRRANRLVSAAGLGINPIIGFTLNILIPWDVFLAYQLGKMKEEMTVLVRDWLNLWYELEAFWGLANFGAIYPEATFAQFYKINEVKSWIEGDRDNTVRHKQSKQPVVAVQMGHPLIPSEMRVCNNFSVNQLGDVLIISGSNMSGKSTFLRTVGINICLAMAGAPVLAQQFSLVPFRIAASITINDSLADGYSFFYAEVRRLKFILEELQKTHKYPLFFLIDEIFRGTNNQERLIGSQSFVQALVGVFGTGLIATHDLALVNLAERNEAIKNAHFRDDVANGRMVFDYQIYPGPCPTTNALKIMQLAGLPVEIESVGDPKN